MPSRLLCQGRTNNSGRGQGKHHTASGLVRPKSGGGDGTVRRPQQQKSVGSKQGWERTECCIRIYMPTPFLEIPGVQLNTSFHFALDADKAEIFGQLEHKPNRFFGSIYTALVANWSKTGWAATIQLWLHSRSSNLMNSQQHLSNLC